MFGGSMLHLLIFYFLFPFVTFVLFVVENHLRPRVKSTGGSLPGFHSIHIFVVKKPAQPLFSDLLALTRAARMAANCMGCNAC